MVADIPALKTLIQGFGSSQSGRWFHSLIVDGKKEFLYSLGMFEYFFQ